MKIHQYTSAADFLTRVEDVLLRQECVFGLTLGICHALVRDVNRYGSRPFLASVEKNAELELAVLMTPPHKLQLCGADDCAEEALHAVAQTLHEDAWPVPAVLASPPLAERFASIWCELTGVHSKVGMRQRIHELRTVIPPTAIPGEVVRAGEADIPLAEAWIAAFHEDAMHGAEPPPKAGMPEAAVREGRLFFWDDGGRRSMAARTRPTPNGESIGAVYTPPEYRRHGYASAVVAGLSQLILNDGKAFCMLFTDLANPTSNHIYREIGYTPIADQVDIHFDGGMPV